LDRIPFQLDAAGLRRKLHVKEGSHPAEELDCLIHEAQMIGKPKALYKEAFIESRTDETVTVDGITFKSRVLRVNLDNVYRVFPHAVTCGLELDAWSKKIADFLQGFWAEEIKETVLYLARDSLLNHVRKYHQLGEIARMNPGSLADWPIEEQRPLFTLLGNAQQLIGVHLTPSLMMVPTKSVSGILFPTEFDFTSCQLCPREVCPGRKAPYDKDLYDKKYRLTKGESSHP
jgi:Vitamin B12 dependent methionine synthase, activation domain